ncbi:MAG TPA: dihydroxyacetone kinase operon transcriptional regulator DhaR [Anaerolineae bacterium]|nr:dihydroxyacetone kinase operon transcriptional regulator DhaR [Anaerolineae bacterium]
MQPSSGHLDLAHLRQVWQRFTLDAQPNLDLDPLVMASWHRCAPLLNPNAPPQWTYVSSEVLPLTLSQHATLRAIARPIMEDIHQFIEGTQTLLLLLDSTTCVLEIVGDIAVRDYVLNLGIRQGAFLDEKRVGTNAFAIALIEGSPAQVVGPEHFARAFHSIGSTAAPIFGLDGRLVGAVGTIGLTDSYCPEALGIATAAARAIENQLQADLYIREANTRATELNAIMKAISEGILAWSAQGIITHLNPQASELLGLNPTLVVGRPLIEHVTLPEVLAQAVSRGEDLSDVETSLGQGHLQRECLVSLRAIRNPEGEPVVYIATLRQIEQVRQLVHRLVGAQARLTLDSIVGHSPAAQQMRRQALSAAEARACVLLRGEGGTSKNVLARAIHNGSRRSGGPFLAINCRAIPRDLALSEFLGYEAGAFGAPSAGRPSKFELAHGGTLFLEEIESLPLETQAALLRVIEGGDVIRLGGTRVIPVEVRVIASSTASLEACVAEGAFRSDLLFRLRSFVITTTPLRERPEDIPLIIDRILEKLSVQVGYQLTLTPQVCEALSAYPWPGNIRELESVMERAALMCDRKPIDFDNLPAAIRQRRAMIPGKASTEPVHSLVEAERLAILSAGRAASGNLSEAARLLGIGRTTLWRKMKELGIITADFRTDERN